MSNSKKTARQILACLTVTSLAFLSVPGALIANAQSNIGIKTVTGEGNIDPDAKGTINIHKLEAGTITDGPGSPNDQPDKTGVGVADVVFTASPISNLNLTTPAGWDNLPTALDADVCDTKALQLKDNTPATFGTEKASANTDADGNTSIGELPVAAYLVCETSAPSTVTQKAAPFIVTVPFPNQDPNNTTATANNEWLYEIDVYPKNVVVQPLKKEVTVLNNGIGTDAQAKQVEYTITATIPHIAEDDSYTSFTIADTLIEGHENGVVTEVTLDGTAITSYIYQAPTITFDDMDALKAARGKKLVVKIQANVNGVYHPLDNVATMTFQSNNVASTTTDSDKVKTSWGNALLHKQDGANNKALKGAKFEIFNADTPYAADCSTVTATGDALAINGATQFVSDENGTVNFAGLFVDQGIESVQPGIGAPNVYNPVQWDNGNTQRCYVVKEVEAPAGYVLPTDNATPISVAVGTTTEANTTVDNTKQSVLTLPMTGAAGQVLLILAGLSLLLFAVGSTFVQIRRKARK